MKNIYFFALLLFMGFTGYGQKIVIDEFKDYELSKYQDDTEITGAISNGFILHVSKELGVDKVVYKNAGGAYFSQTISSTDETSNVYDVQNIPVLADNTCKIILYKGGAFKTITLKVKPGAVAGTGAETNNTTNCNINLFTPKDNCPDSIFAEYFGLDPADFLEDDVIYVYDFNKLTSKRRMYKFTKGNGDAVLKKTKVNLTKEELRAKKQVWIKVANINRFMYDVSIADSLFYYDSKPSALFNRMFIGDSLTTLGAMMDKGVIQNKSDQEKVDKILNNLDCFNKMYASLKAELIKAFDPCQTFASCNEVDFKAISLKLNEVRTGILLLQIEFTDANKALEELKKKKTDCAALEKDEKKLTEELGKLKVGDAGYDAAKEKVDKLKACKSEAQARQADIDKAEKELAVVNGLAEIKVNLPTDAHLKQLSVFLLNMVEQNQALIRGPIQLEGNLLDVTININSNDSIVNKFGYPNFRDKIHFAIPVYGRPFVSFSSGSFLALDKRLREKTYAWQEVGNGAGHILAESGYSNPVAGFSALVNVQWGLSSYVGIGPSVGVGLTIEEQPRLSYLVGGSVFLGKSSQLAITGGVAIMQVDKLAKNFEAAYENQTIFATTRDIEYYKNFKVGPFISLTYTLFKISKSK